MIEVLLAIALMALIMAMAYGGFRTSIRATTSGESIIEETNRLRVVQQFVRRQLMLTQSLVIETPEMDEGLPIRFEGERDRVRFVAPMPGYLSYGGPYVQQLSLERGEEGLELVYYYAMLNGYEPGDLEHSDGVVLMERIDSAEFIFLGLAEDAEEPQWADFWETPERLPMAVGLIADLDRANGTTWPDLVAPVMVDGGQMNQGREIRRASDILRPPRRGGRRDERR